MKHHIPDYNPTRADHRLALEAFEDILADAQADTTAPEGLAERLAIAIPAGWPWWVELVSMPGVSDACRVLLGITPPGRG